MIEELLNICTSLIQTNSRIEKQHILEQESDNEEFKKLIKFLLDPNVVTGISTKKLHKAVNGTPWMYDNLFDLLDYIAENNTGSDGVIATVQWFITHNAKYEDFLSKIVTKTLRLGVDAKTVNAVNPGLIPTFDVMLGTPIDKCKIPTGTWFSISRKLNGVRCVYVNGKFFSRQGKEFKGLTHIRSDIESALLKMGFGVDMVVDGELLYKNPEGLSDSEAFQVGVGIANSDAAQKPELKYVVFDMLTRRDFETGRSHLTYFQRKHNWLIPFKEFMGANDNVQVVPFCYEGNDQSEIWKWLDYAEQGDWEGIMLNLNTPYECKRTKNLIKVKKFHECDLKCTGIEEGGGDLAGTLGAIVCNYRGHILRCGSGFTQAQRRFYWENPEQIVGKIVTIKYKEETKNKNGGISVQFPVFQIVRTDKTEESYN